MRKLILGKKGNAIKPAIAFMGGLLVFVIIGFVLIVVAGNLADSTGFATGSLEQNQTDRAMQNVTSGIAELFSNIPTWFSILSVVIIILLIVLIISALRGAKLGSGGSFSA